MKKSTLLMVLSLVLAVAMGVGSTLAYLTDSDGDVNVMTVGYVTITQNEQERVEIGKAEEGLQPFTPNKPMNPAVFEDYSHKEDVDANGWNVQIRDKVKNYVDKIVSVTNTGANPAYVRTIYAIPESGDFDTKFNSSEQWLHWNGVSDGDTDPKNGWFWGTAENGVEWPANTDAWNMYDNVVIDGKTYDIYIATNMYVQDPKDTTAPSLLGLYLDPRVDCQVNDATGEKNYTFTDATGKVWDLGDISTLEVLVLSQAVQADGFADAWAAFDAAFPTDEEALIKWLSDIEQGTPGDKNDTNNPPILVGDDEKVSFEVPSDAFRVTNTAELEAAVADGKTTILLAAGEYDIDGCKNKNLTLIGEDQEKTIIKVVGEGQSEGNGQLDYGFDSSTVTFQNLTIKTNNETYAGYARLNGTYKDVNFDSCYCFGFCSVYLNYLKIN